jgi:5-methylcytosine-specific restriction endonuclease McrA
MHTDNILDKPIVLALNSAWQIIGHRTVRAAIVALTGGNRDQPPAFGLDIGYASLPNGELNFDRPSHLAPVRWEDWLKLPVRDFDLSISTAKQRVRVPTVIVAANFNKVPMIVPRMSRDAIYERDGGRCQYTGEFVGRHEGNLDHIIPVSRNGATSFENVVWAKTSVNSAKANRLPHEAGLKLIRPPVAPKKIPVSVTIREAKHRDWTHFIKPTPHSHDHR